MRPVNKRREHWK